MSVVHVLMSKCFDKEGIKEKASIIKQIHTGCICSGSATKMVMISLSVISPFRDKEF